MKRIFALILTGMTALLLAGCGQVFNQKQQVKDAAQTTVTSINTELDTLKVINDTTATFPSTLQRALKTNPKEDLRQLDGPVKQLMDKRDKAYTNLNSADTNLAQAQRTLTKAANQSDTTLPKKALAALTSSLKLTTLDHKTLIAYYKEVTHAEQALFDQLQDDPTKADVNTALSQINQYYSTLGQQIDVSLANLNTALDQAKTLTKQLD